MTPIAKTATPKKPKGPVVGGWPGDDKTNPGGPPGGNRVDITSPPADTVYSGRDIQGNYNYNQAAAYANSDPRYAAKAYQRAGLSSSAGTASLGAADSADRFASGMARAEMGRLQDAYTNAGYALDDASARSQFGLALAGLQEDAAQRQYLNQIRSMQNATGFMGDIMSGFTGSGGGLLSGLL